MNRGTIAGPERWAIGLGLLVFALLHWPLLGLHSIEMDDAASLILARRPLTQIAASVGQEEMHPPLFFISLHPLAVSTRTDWVLRLLPLGISLLLLWRVTRFAWILGGSTAGLLTLWLGLSNATFVEISLNLRMYGLAALLSMLALEAAIAWWVPPEGADDQDSRLRPLALLGYAAAAIAALYTAYQTAALIAGIAVLAPLLGRSLVGPRLRWWVAAQGLVGLCFAPWIPIALGQSHRWVENLPPGAAPLTLPFVAKLRYALGGFGKMILADRALEAWHFGTIGGLLLLVIGISMARRVERTTTLKRLIMVCLIALPALALGLEMVLVLPSPLALQPRYLFLILPFLWCLLGLWAAGAGRFGLVLVLLVSVTNLWSIQNQIITPQDDYRGAAAIIAAKAEPRSQVLVMAPFIALPLQHYWPAGKDQLIPLEAYQPTPEGRAELQRLLAPTLEVDAPPDEVWIVLSRTTEWRDQALDRGGAALVEAVGEWFPGQTHWHVNGVEVVRCRRMIQAPRGVMGVVNE